MPLANTQHQYGSLAKTFHWSIALLILTLIPLGIIANGLPYDTSEQLAQKAFLFSLHKTLGVAVFFLALARIAWALSQPKPGALNAERKAEHWAAETVHWLLYGSLVLVPLSGWIHHAATTGFAPIWWPFGQNLPMVPKDETLAGTFAGLHIVLERVLALSIFLHLGGALKHHFIDKDETLRRMWFGANAAPNVPKHAASFVPVISALVVWAAALGIGSAMGIYAKHGSADAPAVAQLEEVASEWTVTSGTLAIETTQFGGKVAGSFADWTAAIQFDSTVSSGTAGSVDVTIAIGSLTLGSVTKQALGTDYFAAEEFPTAQFKAEISPFEDRYMADGTLTLRGVEMPVSFPFTLNVTESEAQMTGAVELNRLDFGIGQNMPDESSLGFAVDVLIELTAARGGQ